MKSFAVRSKAWLAAFREGEGRAKAFGLGFLEDIPPFLFFASRAESLPMFKDGTRIRGARECKGGGSSEVCQGHAWRSCVHFPLKPDPCHVAESKGRRSAREPLFPERND